MILNYDTMLSQSIILQSMQATLINSALLQDGDLISCFAGKANARGMLV